MVLPATKKGAFGESEILRYLLEKIVAAYNVKINLADIGGISKIHHDLDLVFRQYNYHNNAFCNYVKKDEALHSRCIKSKHLLCQRIKEPFFGKCYLGISELYYPVWFGDKLIALICVGQFADDLEKSLWFVRERAKEYGLDPLACALEYRKVTKEINFPIADLKRDTGVVASFLTLLYKNAILERFIETDLKGSMGTAADYYQEKAIVSSAVEFIDHNYRQNISLDLIAENCYCHPVYLSHLFNKEMGFSLTDYINQCRIEAAKRLLDLTELSITQISLEVGFNDPSYFSKVFKNIQGINPTHYRQRKH